MTEATKAVATIDPAKDRKKILASIVDLMTKEIGPGTLMLLGSKPLELEAWPTGSLSLDLLLGPGGIPRGKVIEIYGPEGSGKTTLTLSIIAQVQRMLGLCAYIDAEHAVDLDYAKKIGVNVDELLFNQPDYGEQGLTVAAKIIETGHVSLIVVDSVAALVPKAELEGEIEDNNMALQARMMGKAMRKLKVLASANNCTVIFINQLREKPGVSFGNPEYTPGGKALKFFSDIRLEIRRGSPIKQGEVQIGNRAGAKTIKNKVAPPFRKCTFDIIFGEGIDGMQDILSIGVTQGAIEKSGSWYSANGIRIGQGEPAAKKWLAENPDLCTKIENDLRKTTVIDAVVVPNPKAPKVVKTKAPAPKEPEVKAVSTPNEPEPENPKEEPEPIRPVTTPKEETSSDI